MRNKKRYLAFNMVGVIDITDQETHHVVNVEFHDKAARRGYHFQDHYRYTMASLGQSQPTVSQSKRSSPGEQGAAYASPASETQPSMILYRPYDSWASTSEWTFSLPSGEEAVSVVSAGPAEGMGAVAVATSQGFIRFFSNSGIQRYMWRLGEDVVTMTGGKEMILIVHREGGTSLDGGLCLCSQ